MHHCFSYFALEPSAINRHVWRMLGQLHRGDDVRHFREFAIARIIKKFLKTRERSATLGQIAFFLCRGLVLLPHH